MERIIYEMKLYPLLPIILFWYTVFVAISIAVDQPRLP